MSNINKNKFVSYVILLLALFILILFTKDKISIFQENNDLLETYNAKLSEKKVQLTTLNNLKIELTASSEKINKFNINIKEDEIIDYIYSFVEESNKKEGVSIIKSITIGKSIDTEIGFKETTLNLNLQVANEYKLRKILEFLTSTKSKYNFYINSFSFPYGKNIDEKINVSIPLKILYK